MKIRLGFVSNSSSTSYVIALTRDFKATPEQLEKFISECQEYNYEEDAEGVAMTPMTPEQAAKAISEIVEEICKCGEWSWYDGDIEIDNFTPFMYACSDDFEICAVDGGHGCDSLVNILADDLKDKTNKFIKLCECEGKKDED